MSINKLEISKELLAKIDFENTVNGGMATFDIQAEKDKNGYRMSIKTPTIDKEKINIEVSDQRFMVYYLIDVLEGEGKVPYFLANLPLLPDVDAERILARFDDESVYIRAPFNDLGKGKKINVELE